MKRVWKYLSQHKSDVNKVVVASLVGASLNAMIPAIYGKLVDFIIKKNISSEVFMFMGIWLALTLSISIINRYIARKKRAIAIKCDRELVAACSAHLIKMSMSFHKDHKIGEVFDRITRAAGNLHSIITQVIFSTVPQFLTIAIVLAILVFVNYKLTLVLLAVIALYGLLTLIKIKPLETTEDRIDQAYGEANGDIHDSVLNAKAVKSFTAEKHEEQKYRDGNQKIFGEFSALTNAWSNIQLMQSSILGIGFFAVFITALKLLSQNEITAGQLVMLLGYVSLIYAPLTSLSENYITIKQGLVSINRAESLLEEKAESYKGGKVLIDIKGEIKFDKVSFAYNPNGSQKTLENISFTVRQGEMIALVGESGAGKTTLLDLVSRFIEPSKGKIFLDELNIVDINLCSLREKIAIVPQEVILFNDTVSENIRFGRFGATYEEVILAANAANAHDFIMKFPNGYNQMVGERGVKLSAGQKQRLAIARAILRNPKILILDEATSSLDSISENQVQDELKKLTKGRTVFVIAHRLSTIKEANKILVLKDGVIAEEGTHKELVKRNGIYRRMYELQQF